MIKANKVRNSTTLDETGFKTGIIRQKNESLSSFKKRIYKNFKNIYDTNSDSFERSLGCITTLEDIDLFNIELVDSSLNLKVELKNNRLRFYLNDQVFHQEKITDLKFNLKVKETFEKYPQYFSITNVSVKDWEYLKAENILTFSTNKMYQNYELNNKVNVLPKKYPVDVLDHSGFFETDTNDEELVLESTLYNLSGNVLYKSNQDNESVMFTYRDFPITLKWLPIKAMPFNDINFNDILYDITRDNEIFGEITNNTIVENFEKDKVLSQKGARIINSVLSKENTYWGK